LPYLMPIVSPISRRLNEEPGAAVGIPLAAFASRNFLIAKFPNRKSAMSQSERLGGNEPAASPSQQAALVGPAAWRAPARPVGDGGVPFGSDGRPRRAASLGPCELLASKAVAGVLVSGALRWPSSTRVDWPALTTTTAGCTHVGVRPFRSLPSVTQSSPCARTTSGRLRSAPATCGVSSLSLLFAQRKRAAAVVVVVCLFVRARCAGRPQFDNHFDGRRQAVRALACRLA
jgi:hypothetical protein